MKNTALLLIDIQNDYFPKGVMELSHATEAAKNAAKILSVFRKNNLPCFHIQHESISEGAFIFLPETKGQEINALVAPLDSEITIKKHFPNSFLNTSLLEQLNEKKITKLIITGMMTLMCVDATTRAAKDFGFECVLIHDSTAARALEFNGHKVSAENVQAAFISALALTCDKVQSTEDFIHDCSV
ncbi:MAG: cysteine hydrolase [Desulfobacterales bacterium]|nr:cysteine hydrolase [Desulfobacterales bacterium]